MLLDSHDHSPDGLRRRDEQYDVGCNFPKYVRELEDALTRLEEAQLSGYAAEPFAILRDAYAAVFDRDKPADSVLDHYHEHLVRGETLSRYPRLKMSAHFTPSGHLSVTLSPCYLDESGNWARANEWKSGSFSPDRVGSLRPTNEVLYIRGAEYLFFRKFGRNRYTQRDAPPELTAVDQAACRLIVSTFWKVVTNLHLRFSLTISRRITWLEDEARSITCLEIAGGRTEHIEFQKRWLASLEATTGHPVERYLDIIALAGGSSGGMMDLIRALRTHGSRGRALSQDFAPAILKRVKQAVAYGLCELPVSPTPIVPKVREPKPEKRRQEARQSPPQGPNKPTLYDGLRAAPWDDNLADEFDVATTLDFVRLLNERRKARGRKPVTQGDFPSSRKMLLKLVDEARSLKV